MRWDPTGKTTPSTQSNRTTILKNDYEDIFTRAQQGIEPAVTQLVERFQDMAVGYTFSILGDLDAAKDAAQEAFIEALPILDRVHSARSFPSWFRRVLFKQCDRITRGRKMQQLDETTLTDPGKDILERMASDEIRRVMWQAIRGLTDEERTAITLHYMGNLTHEAIGEFMELSAATVNNRLRSARANLKEGIERMGKQSLRDGAPSNNDDFVNAVSFCRAAETGDLDALRRILNASPDLVNAEHPHIQGKARQTAIHFAAREGHADIVAALLTAGADPLRPFFNNYPVPCALTLARDGGHHEIVTAIETHIARSIDADSKRLSAQDSDGNTLLHLAVYHRHRPLVGSLLRSGADPEIRNTNGQKPIHLALYNGMGGPGPMLRDPYLDIAGILLDHGAELDLWVASAIGDTSAVQRLVQDSPESINAHNGADRYPGGANYPLAIAAHGGHLDIVRILLEHGADPDLENDNRYRESDQLESGVPLVFAIARGHFDIAHLLIDRGARVDVSMIHSGPGIVDVAMTCGNQDLIDRIVIKGGKPLVGHYVDTGNYLIIRELLDRAAHQEDGRWTIVGSLLLAGVRGPDLNVVEMCLEKEPKLVAGEGSWGRGSHCLIYYIARSAYLPMNDKKCDEVVSILERLLAYGIDVDDPDRDGRTTLHTCSNALRGYEPDEDFLVDLMRRLVEVGANLDTVDKDLGTTPLGYAIRYGRFKLAEYFLEAGASPNPKKARKGASPIELAEAYGDDHIRSVLKEATHRSP